MINKSTKRATGKKAANGLPDDKTGILMRARVTSQAGGAIHQRLFDLEDEPEKIVPRETALAWWAWAVGTIESIARQTVRLAKEVDNDGSPLFGLFNSKRLKEAAGKLDDAGMINAWPMLATNDPLAGLPRDRT